MVDRPLVVDLVAEVQRLAGPDDRRKARRRRHAQVSELVLEVDDVEIAGVLGAVRQLARVG